MYHRSQNFGVSKFWSVKFHCYSSMTANISAKHTHTQSILSARPFLVHFQNKSISFFCLVLWYLPSNKSLGTQKTFNGLQVPQRSHDDVNGH